jgi:glutathione S-transferase
LLSVTEREPGPPFSRFPRAAREAFGATSAERERAFCSAPCRSIGHPARRESEGAGLRGSLNRVRVDPNDFEALNLQRARWSVHELRVPLAGGVSLKMKHLLYYYPANANLAPHILLEEAGAEHELVLVDRRSDQQKSPEYLKLNPNGRIPVLVCGELVLFEAAAICLYLADKYPEARLAPALGTAQRAHFYKWLTFLTNTLQPAYMAFRYPEQYSDEPQALDGVRRAAVERIRQAFQVLDEALASGPFLLGAEYSACDAYLYMLTWWSERLSPAPSELPCVRRCVRAVGARPATRRACEVEGIELRFT